MATDAVLSPPTGLAALRAEARTQWTMLRICLEERLVYRGDFALGTLMRFLPIVTQVFLWGAIFHSVSGSESAASGATEVAGYSYSNVIAYYLLTMVSRAFSSMPGLASGIAREIREGTIKKYLVQPVDLVNFLFWSRVAHKLVYYLVAAIPFALVFFLCRSFLPGWPPPEVMAAYVASLLMAFLLGFLLESTIGMLGFWFLEVSSLLFVYMLFSFFFSGHMFPIDMLPSGGPISPRFIVELIPLQYLAYFPSAVFLQKLQGADLVRGLAIQASWVLTFLIANRVVYHYGVKRYSGYGG